MKVVLGSAELIGLRVLGCGFVCFCMLMTSVHAQAPPIPSVGGRHPIRPVVPLKPPRPLTGIEPGQQLPADTGAEQPVANLVESYKSTDAAVEVIVGQGRLLTTRRPIAGDKRSAFVATADPTIVDFELLPNPRMIRITGLRPGVTDLSITTDDGETYAFEIHVVYDLKLLAAYLRQMFPDALLKLSQIREHLVVEGQARTPQQVSQIITTLEAFLSSVETPISTDGGTQASSQRLRQPDGDRLPSRDYLGQDRDDVNLDDAGITVLQEASRPGQIGRVPTPQIINLIKVPGVHQVMLQVKIAELDRTGLREIGTDLFIDASPQAVLGTQISGARAGLAGLDVGLNTTVFGIFSGGDFQIFLNALRRNSLVSVLAEPNLVTMNGHEANFLAGGQFPVPISQETGSTPTVEYKDFGVQLTFLPFILDDDVIRLSVTPEVSTIDFALGTTLVVGGDPVPGLNTRRATTTVELREGQTLAIAGLLQVEIDGQTDRIPGLGDLPYIGPLFSNTSHRRKEKELLVLVTPYLVSPMCCDPNAPVPGSDVLDPTDRELYLMGRIEGRTGRQYRSTMGWDDLQQRLMRLDKKCVNGPVGFSNCR